MFVAEIVVAVTGRGQGDCLTARPQLGGQLSLMRERSPPLPNVRAISPLDLACGVVIPSYWRRRSPRAEREHKSASLSVREAGVWRARPDS
ncbi:hypothetical protein BaRGS_00025516 [Batillaria attramentaria]|uniref:Uncharacterized protein n=1 Tax=Batillaria attramentaria TaxID=370345 RepID=A0ABD0K818_9CAEN